MKKSKASAIAMVAILGAPLVLANSSWAENRGPRSPASASRATARTHLEAEMRFRASDIKAEAEVEFGQGTINGVVKTKLGAEVEIFLLNPATAPDATLVDAQVHVGAATCKFTNDPQVLGPVTVGTKTFYKVEFQGSLSQSGADPVVLKGLDCGGGIPAVVLGDAASADVTGLPDGVTTPTLSGVVVKD